MSRSRKPYIKNGWYCTSRPDGNHQRLVPVAKGKTAAEKAMHRYLADAQEEEKPKAGPRRLAEVIDAFLDAKSGEVTAKTFQYFTSRLQPLHQKFGDRRLDSLDPADGRAFKKWLQEEYVWTRAGRQFVGVGPTTVNCTLRTARAVFRWACAPTQSWLTRDPWSELKPLRRDHRRRTMTQEEFEALRDTATQRTAELLTFLWLTGLRPGEVCVLTADMIDFKAHKIRIPATQTKTNNIRVVTMIPEIETLLRKRIASGAVDPLFPGSGNKRLTPETIWHRFKRVLDACCKAGKIQKSKNGENLTVYNCRHARITNLLESGLDIVYVAKEAGHRRISTTVSHYIHLGDDDITKKVWAADANRLRPAE